MGISIEMYFVRKIIFCLPLLACLAGCVETSDINAPRDRAPIQERELLADSQTDYPSRIEEQDRTVQASPKQGWGDFDVEKEKQDAQPPVLEQVLLYLPNRVLDFMDIFRVDVGVGPAAGGVIRVTKWAQAGIRTVAPASLRIGDFGRTWPVKVEHSSEIGISPAFVQSSDRKVCPGEVGVGLDLFIVGGYFGICFDELYDFVGGIFLYDPKGDDIK